MAARNLTVEHELKQGDVLVRALSGKLKMTLSPTAARRPETVPALERLTELLNEEETA